jgi:hypothetical protein
MTRYRGYKAFGTRFVLPAAAIVAAMYPSACATATTPRSRTDHIREQGSFAVGGTVVTNPDSTAASICCAVAVR